MYDGIVEEAGGVVQSDFKLSLFVAGHDVITRAFLHDLKPSVERFGDGILQGRGGQLLAKEGDLSIDPDGHDVLSLFVLFWAVSDCVIVPRRIPFFLIEMTGTRVVTPPEVKRAFIIVGIVKCGTKSDWSVQDGRTIRGHLYVGIGQGSLQNKRQKEGEDRDARLHVATPLFVGL